MLVFLCPWDTHGALQHNKSQQTATQLADFILKNCAYSVLSKTAQCCRRAKIDHLYRSNFDQ